MSKRDLWLNALIQENKRLQKELANYRNDSFLPNGEQLDKLCEALGKAPKPTQALRDAFNRVNKRVPKELQLKSPVESFLENIPSPETTILADSRTRITVGNEEYVFENCPECGHPAEVSIDSIEDCRVCCSNVECDYEIHVRGIMGNVVNDWNIYAKCK